MQGRYRRWIVLLTLLAAGDAAAQLRLPSITLPALPERVLPQTLAEAHSTVLTSVTELRRLRLRDLVRTHRGVVEMNRDGDAVVSGEIMALPSDPSILARLHAAGFTTLREQRLPGLESSVTILSTPPGSSLRKALKQLRESDPGGAYDYNHLYAGVGETSPVATSASTQQLVPDQRSPNTATARIGLLDSGVDGAHPSFATALVHRWGCDGRVIPAAHGTAVASLLIGNEGLFHGGLPGAQLFAADVYCGAATGGAADSIVAALAWMIQERVPVINVSLVGPRNALLEIAVRAVVQRGSLLVAAVGNDGPAAPPLYPAAFPGVIGVTGVDVQRHVLLEAGRGAQVMFAAPGAQMAAADLGGGYAEVRGTSFAAPVVAALLAAELPEPNVDAAESAVKALTQHAVDLGATGRDFTYGVGLVGEALRVDLKSLPRR